MNNIRKITAIVQEEVNALMYPYIILNDETEISHSHVINKNGQNEIEVHFERPAENGFDTARCALPSYVWIIREGFSEDELQDFIHFLKSNAHLLFKYAASGGIQVA